MSSKKSGGKGFSANAGGNPPPKGKGIESTASCKISSNIDELSRNMANLSADTAHEGEWEVIAKKSKNQGGVNAAKQWGSSTSAPKAWGHPEAATKTGTVANGGAGRSPGNNWAQAVDPRRQAGRGNPKPQSSSRGWESAYMAPPPAVSSPLQHGWQWAARSGSSSQSKISEDGKTRNEMASKLVPQGGSSGEYDSGSEAAAVQPDDHSDDDDLVEDTDDEYSDDYDSDVSQKSHETQKKSKWFRAFFEVLDGLTVEQINEQTRQWHCPACQDGPGAIDWYRGLQPLMTHAQTKGSKRVKLHRDLAKLLEEELRRRGTSVIPPGEAFGKWKGLRETMTDHEIVWPPMVVVMNTVLEQDDNDKWIGMGNQELLEYFSTYDAVKARHSYGPQGHRGISVLIFEALAIGYLEAERLHKHFVEQGTDMDAWERRRVLFYPGGKRQLYGFLARKEDMDYFNQHAQGKFRLKFEMRSYQEMVVGPMKQMSEDNQQLLWYKNKVAKQLQHSKTLEESFGAVSQKLRETMEENRIVRLRTKIQHEENKEEMDYQEQFFKDQMAKVRKATEEKEKMFEKLLQEERAKAKQSDVDTGTKEDRRLRKEEIARFIDSQVKGIEEFEVEREKLIRAHEEKKVELRRRQLEEEVNLEKEFDNALTKLMKKYAPLGFESSTTSS